MQWADSEFMKVRRGEFYELLLITLFGMYLMISARHFLLFIIGLETASLPLAALVAFDKQRYGEATRPPSSICSQPCSPRRYS